MDEEKKYYQIELVNEIKNIRKILCVKIRLSEKISEIFKKICIAINTRNIKPIPKLVEFTINARYTLDNIKIAFSKYNMRTDFDTVYKFCRSMSCWEDKK